MKLQINSKDFQTYFISPIMEISKFGKTPIFIEDDIIYSLSLFDNNSVYLYNTYKPILIEDHIDRFNINLDKLKRALACINKDKQCIDLTISNNALSYKDEELDLNLKLIENSIVAVPKFNIKSFRDFEFVFNAKIGEDKIRHIKRAMNFAADTTKFYLSTDNNKIFITFADKQSSHNDDIKIILSDSYTGTMTNNIYDISILRLVTNLNSEFTIKIGINGALCMKLEQSNSEQNYITTQLKK